MLYRKMPKNGDELSILGFGLMRLPVTESGQIDEPRTIRMIRAAIDHGINYLDTAWPYHGGESESVLGRALAGGYRDKVRIATKLPSWMIESRADIDFYLDYWNPGHNNDAPARNVSWWEAMLTVMVG